MSYFVTRDPHDPRPTDALSALPRLRAQQT